MIIRNIFIGLFLASTIAFSSQIQDAGVKIGAAINAAKIADGSVTSAEFQFINSLTSNAQTQLNGKVDGPASATDNAIARFDSTTGKLIQNSGVTVSDGDVVSATGFVGPLTGAVTGNADTATALAANPTDCAAGTKATAIDASGNLTCSAVSMTADVSGTLPVANGGTGAATLTANNVILGNGTSAVQTVAPGTSGNVLTSNGTTWTSAAPSGGGAPVFAIVNGNAGATVGNNQIIFPNEISDPSNIYSTGTGQVTVPSGKTFCSVRWYTTGDGTNRIIMAYKNGSKVTDGSNNDTNGAGVQNGTAFIDVTAGDVIDIRPSNTMTGSANANAGFSCW